MTTKQIEAGDRVYDPMNGEWRTVLRVEPGTQSVYLEDGGVMGIEECTDVLLPSEEIPSDGPPYDAATATGMYDYW